MKKTIIASVATLGLGLGLLGSSTTASAAIWVSGNSSYSPVEYNVDPAALNGVAKDLLNTLGNSSSYNTMPQGSQEVELQSGNSQWKMKQGSSTNGGTQQEQQVYNAVSELLNSFTK